MTLLVSSDTNSKLNNVSEKGGSYFILDTVPLPFIDDFSTSRLKNYIQLKSLEKM